MVLPGTPAEVPAPGNGRMCVRVCARARRTHRRRSNASPRSVRVSPAQRTRSAVFCDGLHAQMVMCAECICVCVLVSRSRRARGRTSKVIKPPSNRGQPKPKRWGAHAAKHVQTVPRSSSLARGCLGATSAKPGHSSFLAASPLACSLCAPSHPTSHCALPVRS